MNILKYWLDKACEHPYMTTGMALGALLAILLLTIGIWRTLVLALLMGAGALWGFAREHGLGFAEFFKKIFNK